ncbi:hypothetical protein [Streptomyces chiangmaiensis]|uniref:YCII-related domain-containing protein n=1 Tax=Streptomyces chiangmaiensis TaxID=766497 RepID=A0ABU7FHK3_9ACTN|nr:hypothetical protein [Streptomyces chiangmaiensis]MED7823102.1 hypothetical protein [Streptomyces chiangmaiensis]
MNSLYQDGDYVSAEGAMVGLRVRDEACARALVQRTDYDMQTDGPYPETGCFEPPHGR